MSPQGLCSSPPRVAYTPPHNNPPVKQQISQTASLYQRAKQPHLKLSIETHSNLNSHCEPPKTPLLKDNFSADCSTLTSGEANRYFYLRSPLREAMDQGHRLGNGGSRDEDVEENGNLTRTEGVAYDQRVGVEVVTPTKASDVTQGRRGDVAVSNNLSRAVAWIGIAGEGALAAVPKLKVVMEAKDASDAARVLVFVRDEFDHEGVLISRQYSRFGSALVNQLA